MEKELRHWMNIRFSIRDLEKRIEQLKEVRDQLEKKLIQFVTADNNERRIIGPFQTWISYRRYYDYNIPLIRKLLEPRRLFDEVASVRIKHERFTTILATPGQFSDAEFEDLMSAMVITEAKELLHVRRTDTRSIS